MARGGITFIDVDKAARYLQGQGRNPTVDAIREHLGTGSRTTLAEHLRQWKAAQVEGLEIAAEILTGLSPYWTEHLNRFGVFQLDMQKIMSEIEYDLINLEI